MQEHQVGRKVAAARSRSHYAAQEPHSVLDLFAAKNIMTAADQAPLTGGAVEVPRQVQLPGPVQSRTRLYLMQVIKLLERGIA